MRSVQEHGVPRGPPAFETLFRAEYARLVTVLTALIGDRHRAEAIAQEAHGRALRRWETVCRADRPAMWILGVAVEAATATIRRERDDHGTTMGGAEHALTIGDSTSDTSHENDAELWVAVRSLPDRQRTALVLHDVAGLTTDEIVHLIGGTDETVDREVADARDAAPSLIAAAERLSARAPDNSQTDDALEGILWVTADERQPATRPEDVTDVPLDGMTTRPGHPTTPRADGTAADDRPGGTTRSRRWITVAVATAVVAVLAVAAGRMVLPDSDRDDADSDASERADIADEPDLARPTDDGRYASDVRSSLPSDGRPTMTYRVTGGEAGSPNACITFDVPGTSGARGCFGNGVHLGVGRIVVVDTGPTALVWRVVSWRPGDARLGYASDRDSVLRRCDRILDRALGDDPGVVVLDCPDHGRFSAARVAPPEPGVAPMAITTRGTMVSADRMSIRVPSGSGLPPGHPDVRVAQLAEGGPQCVVLDPRTASRWAEACGDFDRTGSLAAVVDGQLYMLSHATGLNDVSLLVPRGPVRTPRCRGPLRDVLSPLRSTGAMVEAFRCAGDVAVVRTAPVALRDDPLPARWYQLHRRVDGSWRVSGRDITPDCAQVASLCERFPNAVDPFVQARPVLSAAVPG